MKNDNHSSAIPYAVIFVPLDFPRIEHLFLLADFPQYFEPWIVLDVFARLFPIHIKVDPLFITLQMSESE